jgi:hypothetical protein
VRGFERDRDRPLLADELRRNGLRGRGREVRDRELLPITEADVPFVISFSATSTVIGAAPVLIEFRYWPR